MRRAHETHVLIPGEAEARQAPHGPHKRAQRLETRCGLPRQGLPDAPGLSAAHGRCRPWSLM